MRYVTGLTKLALSGIVALSLFTWSGIAICTTTAAAQPSSVHSKPPPKHHKKQKKHAKATAAAGGDFCTLMAKEQKEIEKLIASSDSADVLQDLARRAKDDAKKVEAAAPADLKDDVATVAQASLDEIAALQKADFDFTKVDPRALAGLITPEARAASEHVIDYLKNTCGVDITAGFDDALPDGATP